MHADALPRSSALAAILDGAVATARQNRHVEVAPVHLAAALLRTHPHAMIAVAGPDGESEVLAALRGLPRDGSAEIALTPRTRTLLTTADGQPDAVGTLVRAVWDDLALPGPSPRPAVPDVPQPVTARPPSVGPSQPEISDAQATQRPDTSDPHVSGPRDLGPVIATYSRGARLYDGMVIGGIVLVTAGAWATWSGFADDPGGPLAGTGVGGFLLGVLLVSIGLVHRDRTLTVHRDGIENRRRSRHDRVLYDEVEAIHAVVVQKYVYGVAGGTERTYSLGLRGGRSVTLTSNVPGLVPGMQAVEAAVYPRIHTRAVRTLEAGGIVPFGAVSLDRDTLYLGPDGIPLAEVHDLSLENGSLRLRWTGAGETTDLAVALRTIANAPVFLDLLERLGPPARP